ncbi:MAG: TAXI family TRAP transporter solute-binding subunit [Armatimonadota bacterium]|nr:TAXI family TRAP transporter solute-binding subunit [Armatimonadota bacterium]MDW8155065.1 TAXI family TRAP transporter solute-binding subunit [Armatimonadota bacterium]
MVALLATLLAGPALAGPGPVRISIATAPTGSVAFVVGAGLARLISQYIPGVHATAEVTGSFADNMRLLAARRVELAFAHNDIAYDALRGAEGFQGQAVQIRAVAPLYDSYAQLVTLEGSGIARLPDLKGRRVSTGPPGGTVELTSGRIMRAVGIDPERDIRRERLPIIPAADALRDRKIDALWWVAGLPVPPILDLAAAPGTRIRVVPLEEALEPLRKQYGPMYMPGTISPVVYPGMDRPVTTVVVPAVLVAHRELSEDLVYAVTRLLFERRAELEAVHPAVKEVSLLRITGRTPIPFHPGAARYYRERGVPGF